MYQTDLSRLNFNPNNTLLSHIIQALKFGVQEKGNISIVHANNL